MAKKSLGQHWLFDLSALGAMCSAANVQPGDTVLEIGPGKGSLTIELTQRAKQVVAVELDDQLARELPARVPAANLQVVHSDIMSFNLSTLPAGYKVVANVPYYVTSKIVRLLLESPHKPSLAVLLVQKEVAERLAARPGKMSILSVSAQLYADIQLKEVIPAALFAPPPQVDSQIVVLQVRHAPLFTDIQPDELMRVVRAGFSEKRKKLRNSLSGAFHLTKDAAENLLKEAGIATDARAEALTLTEWHSLALACNEHR